MRKKALSVLLTTAMVASMFTACGSKDSNSNSSTGGSGSDKNHEYTVSNGGKVLNIYVWNDEFINRMKDHMPGYVADEKDPLLGTLDGVTVKWTQVASDNNAYQNNLDEKLQKQATAAADDKIDMFLMEADYALKYVDSNYTVPVDKLGITADDTKNMYKYTKDVVTDSNGQLKGLSWQGCPGILFYNRAVAKEVLGTDDQAEVQKAVADWDTYVATAQKMVDAGYKMTATSNDTFRVYSNNVSTKWVENGKVNVDANIKKWAEDTKKLVDMKACGTADLWSDDWSAGFYPSGKVFCYFGPAWLINFCMAADKAGSIANEGGWGATEGPQSFFWGGTWIAGCDFTDNADLVKKIMINLTCTDDILVDIVVKDNDFTNSKPVMEALANGTKKVQDADGNEAEHTSPAFGGINPLPFYTKSADKIDLSKLTGYDQGCNEKFQQAMKNYFLGECSYDEALKLFYKDIKVVYPNLKTE